jgi:hypothetical protein
MMRSSDISDVVIHCGGVGGDVSIGQPGDNPSGPSGQSALFVEPGRGHLRIIGDHFPPRMIDQMHRAAVAPRGSLHGCHAAETVSFDVQFQASD